MPNYKNKTHQEYQREYYLKNKEKRQPYHRTYYLNNCDYIKQYQKQYYRNKKNKCSNDKIKIIDEKIIIIF